MTLTRNKHGLVDRLLILEADVAEVSLSLSDIDDLTSVLSEELEHHLHRHTLRLTSNEDGLTPKRALSYRRWALV